MKTVLLTGAGGFIGKTTIRYLLERGFIVHAVTSKRIAETNLNLYCHKVNLLDTERTAELVRSVKPSHLLHFAWYVEHGKFWRAPENLEWVRASSDLFQNFIAAGGKRIVSAGTCAEYDWRTKSEEFSESDSPINPQTLYGQSKHALHMVLQKYARQFDLSYAWGRIFFLFGAFESPNRFIPSVVRALLQKEEANCSHPNQVRDLMFVERAGDAFVKLLDGNVQGPVNIASGKSYRLGDVAQMIAEIIGVPELLRIGALPPTSNEPLRLVANINRLQTEVDFRARTNLPTALAETINWWKSHI